MRYTTLFHIPLDLDLAPDIEDFYRAILATPSGREAEDLLYSEENPLHDPKHKLRGHPVWTADTLRSPEWAYLSDAVARVRAAHGELDVSAVEGAAMMSLADAALTLGISHQAVGLAITRGEIVGVKVGGTWRVDQRSVDAYRATHAKGGRTTRVPALFARVGNGPKGASLVVAVSHKGRWTSGDFRGSTDGADTLVWPEWSEAVVLWGRGDKARAVRLRPASGGAPEEIAFEGLYARGRWERVGDVENNRARAVEMYKAARSEWGAPDRE